MENIQCGYISLDSFLLLLAQHIPGLNPSLTDAAEKLWHKMINVVPLMSKDEKWKVEMFILDSTVSILKKI